MRRRHPVKAGRALLAATAAGFAVVLSVHAATATGRRTSALATPTTQATATTPTTSTSAPSSSAPSTSSPTTSTSVSSAARSAIGVDEQFGYGSISVKVTVQGTRIVAVSVANLQTLESYSQSLAAQAVPVLTSEVLAAQSSNIQSVSGASYTSAGFAQSLQSALSQLGV
jgi:uncharacterized protein with FMN-binding domain